MRAQTTTAFMSQSFSSIERGTKADEEARSRRCRHRKKVCQKSIQSYFRLSLCSRCLSIDTKFIFLFYQFFDAFSIILCVYSRRKCANWFTIQSQIWFSSMFFCFVVACACDKKKARTHRRFDTHEMWLRLSALRSHGHLFRPSWAVSWKGEKNKENENATTKLPSTCKIIQKRSRRMRKNDKAATVASITT